MYDDKIMKNLKEGWNLLESKMELKIPEPSEEFIDYLEDKIDGDKMTEDFWANGFEMWKALLAADMINIALGLGLAGVGVGVMVAKGKIKQVLQDRRIRKELDKVRGQNKEVIEAVTNRLKTDEQLQGLISKFKISKDKKIDLEINKRVNQIFDEVADVNIRDVLSKLNNLSNNKGAATSYGKKVARSGNNKIKEAEDDYSGFWGDEEDDDDEVEGGEDLDDGTADDGTLHKDLDKLIKLLLAEEDWGAFMSFGDFAVQLIYDKKFGTNKNVWDFVDRYSIEHRKTGDVIDIALAAWNKAKSNYDVRGSLSIFDNR